MTKVSVIVTTYNHEKYISAALDSVIKQKGNFLMELVIGDDFSTDKTLGIINKYKEEHPGLITVIPTSENLGVTKNIKRCIQACSGDYIAFLEGDDYWISEGKIESQLNFLINNKDCALCFNAYYIICETSKEKKTHILQDELKEKRISSLNVTDLIQDNFIGNFSACMYRKKVIEKLPDNLFDMYVVDWMFNICCALHGKIGYIDKIMSVYRIHANGTWSGLSLREKTLFLLNTISLYDQYLDNQFHDDFLLVKIRLMNNYIIKTSLSISSLRTIYQCWKLLHINVLQYMKTNFNIMKDKYFRESNRLMKTK